MRSDAKTARFIWRHPRTGDGLEVPPDTIPCRTCEYPLQRHDEFFTSANIKAIFYGGHPKDAACVDMILMQKDFPVWQDEERTVTTVEQVYATRYDCMAVPGGARRAARPSGRGVSECVWKLTDPEMWCSLTRDEAAVWH